MNKNLVVLLSLLSISCSTKDAVLNEPTLEYYSFKEDVFNGVAKTYITQYLILKEDSLTKEKLESFLMEMTLKAENNTLVKNKSNPKKIVIYIFDDKTKAEKGVSYSLATALKKINEDIPQITINEKQLKQKFLKEEVKFGFSEDQRKLIYEELILIEKNAEIKAAEKFPIKNTGQTIDEINRMKTIIEKNVDKNYVLEKDLIINEKAKLLKRYNISEEILNEISKESFEKDW